MDYICFPSSKLYDILQSVSEVAVTKYIKETTPEIDLISQRKTFLLFGRATIERLIRKGKITYNRMNVHQNSKKYFSRAQIVLALESERIGSIIEVRNRF